MSQSSDQAPAGAGTMLVAGMCPPHHLQITGEIGLFVDINMENGSIAFGPYYEPEVAARAFWNAISAEYREFLKWKAAHDGHEAATQAEKK